MRTALYRFAAILFGASVVLILAGCRPEDVATSSTQSPQTAATAAPGRSASDFSVTTFEGKTIKLSDLRGQPVVVNFWSSTCHFCAQEAPILNEIYQQYQGQGLQVLGVGLDDPQALRVKAQQLKLTYPVGYSAEAGREYGVTGVPETLIIDRQGNVVATLVGARPKSELEAQVKKVL